ncbi:FecR family protein [Algoriphagus litoralis]|uniref:FecR family protein n=1 Tax=Algoriphagus litoralis TaxID=2202829 RepID=UPI0018E4FE98|nr:FecR family protein [Algoriphagus litoralis]
MTKAAFEKLLQKQAEGRTSASENQKIDRIWQQIYDRTQAFDWDKVSELGVKERIQSGINQRIAYTAKTKKNYIGHYFLRVAAVFLLLILGALIYNTVNQQEEIQVALLSRSTNKIQRAQVTLPDGTKVHLNVNSTLNFPETFEEDSRIVQLTGEAFFDVTHDPSRPFYVQSSTLNTKVLGTSFNISSYADEETRITVKTGKVQVSLNTDQKQQVYLMPNETASLPKGSSNLITGKADASSVIGWTSGKLEFESVPFDEVLARLEKYYHTPLVLSNYENKGCLITASFENKGLNFILSNLQLLAKFTYTENEEGEFIIDFKSC